jgi:micrococcal nuclease
MSWSRALPWIVLLLAAGLLLGDVRPPGGWPGWLGGGDGAGALRAGGSATARVERVVDGDTIAVSVGGAAERVRYIGVDTPETVKPNAPVECFGAAASAFNRRLVSSGERVTLRFDQELRDRYGRLLAYVYRERDALFVNARLVDAGAARTLTIAPNTAHAAELARLQSRARAAGRGLWSACL